MYTVLQLRQPTDAHYDSFLSQNLISEGKKFPGGKLLDPLRIKVVVKRWRAPQTATRTYYIMQSLLHTCFKIAHAKKEEPKAKFNSKAKSVRAENCSCAENSRKIFETPFLPI